MAPTTESLAVLISGGLDSAILLGEALRRQATVHPIYIRCGLAWEQPELAHLRQYLASLACPQLRPLTILDSPVGDLYGAHWSISGHDVPDADTPDEAVFLPGRNVLLLGKAILWCHLYKVGTLAMAPLASNPFPDASPDFFRAFQDVVNQAVNGKVRLSFPYATLDKTEVMKRGAGLPLELTFSCIQPQAGRHCGRCNKCGERRRAFADAGLSDKTIYAAPSPS